MHDAGRGMTSYEYNFEAPFAPHQTLHDIVATEYKEPEDLIKLSCESAKAPVQCPELKRNGYKMPMRPPLGLSTIAPVEVSEDGRMENVEQCWPRLIVYADGSVWSVSPM
jgi:hypothetical protein